MDVTRCANCMTEIRPGTPFVFVEGESRVCLSCHERGPVLDPPTLHESSEIEIPGVLVTTGVSGVEDPPPPAEEAAEDLMVLDDLVIDEPVPPLISADEPKE
jgi:hypothetical protein